MNCLGFGDEDRKSVAAEAYKNLCSVIEKRGWLYYSDEQNLSVRFEVTGEDILMNFKIDIDEKWQWVYLQSWLPFNISKSGRTEIAVAVCAASNKVVDGNFDYDILTGKIVFRMSASFRNSNAGENMFDYMITSACLNIDKYNDCFLALDKGFVPIDEFLI